MNWSELYWQRIIPLHIILWPLSLFFIMFLAFKRFLFKLDILHQIKLPVPVVVVDSITIGDANKGSLVIWLIKLLKACGLRPGIISRGYAEYYGPPVEVTLSNKASLIGNKLLLMVYQSKGMSPVWIGYDRVKVAQALLAAHPECNVLICDDGLQDIRLHRDLEIAVVDNSKQNFGNGLILPAGPLRDSLSRLNKVDAVVMSEKSSMLALNTASQMKTFHMRLGNEYFINLLNPDHHARISSFRDKLIHVITDINHSQDFLDQLRYLKINVKSHSIINNQQLTQQDLQFPEAEIILVREEDAVKYLSIANDKFWFLYEEITINIGLREIILKKLRDKFMDPKLLDILVCPLCKGPLIYKKNEQELICKADRLAFPIRDGIPVMLEEEARVLAAEEEI